MHRSVALLATVMSLLSATPTAAMADRDGTGPVYAPRIVDSIHVEFRLPGSGWGQYIGTLGGLPVAGRYAVDSPLADGARCRVDVVVHSRIQRSYVRVGRHIVRMGPNSQAPLRYAHAGHHGGVRWWSGTTAGEDAAAIAVQRAPVKLRSRARRWLLTRVSVTHSCARADEAACRKRAVWTGSHTVQRVVRTLRLADGGVVTEGPFIGPVIS